MFFDCHLQINERQILCSKQEPSGLSRIVFNQQIAMAPIEGVLNIINELFSGSGTTQ